MDNLTALFRISRLIIKSFEEKLNETEKRELQEWLTVNPQHLKLYNSLHYKDLSVKKELIQQLHPNKSWKKLENRIIFRKKTRYLQFFKYAAIVFIIFSTGYVLYIQRETTDNTTSLTAGNLFPEPGSPKATLILNTGVKIELTDQQNFYLQEDSNILLNNKNNVLKIQTIDSLFTSPENYSTLSIPKGGEYRLVLSDGSRIWLNSDSRLRFPSVFNGNKRTVFLEGEAYFEVAHNPQKPFIVSMAKMDVEVLGTRFDVKAYTEDQVIYTTLVSGSVKTISHLSDHSVILRPHEQCVFYPAHNRIETHIVDPQTFLGWVQGRFIFEDETLEEIMKQLGRWYDVEISYQNPQLAQYRFTGNVNRFDDISTLLHMIEKTYHISFSVNGRMIVVSGK